MVTCRLKQVFAEPQTYHDRAPADGSDCGQTHEIEDLISMGSSGAESFTACARIASALMVEPRGALFGYRYVKLELGLMQATS
jgi:hypothetical protein